MYLQIYRNAHFFFIPEKKTIKLIALAVSKHSNRQTSASAICRTEYSSTGEERAAQEENPPEMQRNTLQVFSRELTRTYVRKLPEDGRKKSHPKRLEGIMLSTHSNL